MKTTSIALLEKAVSAAEAVLLDAQNKHDAKPTKATATKLNKAKDALDLAQKALAAAAPAEVPALPKELAAKLKAAVLACDRAGKEREDNRLHGIEECRGSLHDDGRPRGTVFDEFGEDVVIGLFTI